jgi:hypothetical protein
MVLIFKATTKPGIIFSLITRTFETLLLFNLLGVSAVAQIVVWVN